MLYIYVLYLLIRYVVSGLVCFIQRVREDGGRRRRRRKIRRDEEEEEEKEEGFNPQSYSLPPSVFVFILILVLILTLPYLYLSLPFFT